MIFLRGLAVTSLSAYNQNWTSAVSLYGKLKVTRTRTWTTRTIAMPKGKV